MTLIAPDTTMIAALGSFVPPGRMLLPGDDAFAPFMQEPRGRFQGQAAAVLCPENTAQVAAIITYCNQNRIGVVPHGGGTGLVGGQVMAQEPRPIVLSLGRMTQIRQVDARNNTLIAQAGAPLATIQTAAAEARRLFPLSLAAEGTCTIGGNLATNAGGIQVLRYGMARDLCLGIKAVLPSGAVLHGLKTLRKDNTGYDLRNLLIGAEGTLGVITAAALRLFPLPGARLCAMLAVDRPQSAISLFHILQERLGDMITAFELINQASIAVVRRYHPERPALMPTDPPWSVLVEISHPADSGLDTLVEETLAGVIETGLATDGIIAQSLAQRQEIWWWRETIPACNRRYGAIASHDISVPLSAIPDFIAAGTAALTRFDPTLVVHCFGHLGDGNLHYNVFPATEGGAAKYHAQRSDITRTIHDLVAAHQGSISAEHGIGRLKSDDLAHYGDPVALESMHAIKAALDPQGIMNPGAVLKTRPPGA